MAKKSARKSAGAAADAAEKENVRFAPGRWATIMKKGDEFDKDNREEVINISQMAPGFQPDTPGLDEPGRGRKGEEVEDPSGDYSVEQVPEGVIIGMRRGGEYMAVAGFGFRDQEDYVSRGSPVGPGSTRLADVGQK